MQSFDPSKYIAPMAKPLPVILLLDISKSMVGAKIQSLNKAVKEMVDTFTDIERGETEIHVAIITFGGEVRLHQPLVSASEIKWHEMFASGSTPLGVALKMAKAMIEDKNVIPSRAYRPTVVLVSDGQPNDDWQKPMYDFISDGRSSKCDRMAMAIGADADESVLGKFIEGTKNPLFYAENASQLRDFFKFVTMSVTIRTQSKDKNVVPDLSSIEVKPATIEAKAQRTQKPSQPKQPVGNAKNATSSEEGEGYW